MIVLSVAAYLYWDREPEKAQVVVARVFTPIFQAVKHVWRFQRRVFLWALSVISLCILFPVYLMVSIAWVTLKTVVGEPAKVNIKLS